MTRVTSVTLPSSTVSTKDKIAQQIDILPTVMGMLHYPKPYFAFGIDLFNTKAEDTWAVNYLNGVYQFVKKDHVLQFEKPSYYFDLTDPTADDHMPVPENTTGEKTITYSSSKPAVAECLNGGMPRIKSRGTTTITASAGGKTATYDLTVTSPLATYDLTGNAFEVKTIGAVDKKSFDLDGINIAFGGDAETPVALAQPDLGVGVMSLDANGFSFFNNRLKALGNFVVHRKNSGTCIRLGLSITYFMLLVRWS